MEFWGTHSGSRRFGGGERWALVGSGERVPLRTEEGSGERAWGLGSLPRKKIFHLKWRVLCILSGTFCPCPCQKNVEFSAWNDYLVDIEDVLLGNSKYFVRIMKLINFLLHYCIVRQAIWCLKFWNMTKYPPYFVMFQNFKHHNLH